jgi:hypothetical protein
MNERIKQLADEAAKYSAVMALPTGQSGNELFVEKLAELIIKECANAIVNDNRLSDVRTARNGCVRTIKEHFGVEE